MESKSDKLSKKISQETSNLEQVFLEYQKQGLELENKFQPEIEEVKKHILDYFKEDSIGSVQKKLKDIAHYPLGVIMDNFAYFSGKNLRIGIHPGGESGYCVLSIPYPEDFYDDFPEENKKELENIPLNVKDAISNFVPFEPDRKKVSGVVWTSGGIMNRFNNKSDIPHNGLWVSSDQRGSGLAYGLYRLQENIFGVMKTEQAGKLSLLKTYLRLGFIPKTILNPISGDKIPKIKVEEVLREYLTKQQENLDFNVYLERELVGGKQIK